MEEEYIKQTIEHIFNHLRSSIDFDIGFVGGAYANANKEDIDNLRKEYKKFNDSLNSIEKTIKPLFNSYIVEYQKVIKSIDDITFYKGTIKDNIRLPTKTLRIVEDGKKE